MLTALLSLLLAGPVPVTIYVGPMIRDGFVETDKGVQDSVNDIKARLGHGKDGLRVVPVESAATLKLFVVTRGKVALGTSGVVINGTGVMETERVKRLQTVLRFGSYERQLTAEESTWSDAGERIVKDVAVWLAANRERVASARE